MHWLKVTLYCSQWGNVILKDTPVVCQCPWCGSEVEYPPCQLTLVPYLCLMAHKMIIHVGQCFFETPIIQQLFFYSVSQKNPPPRGLVAIFLKRLEIFQPNFTCLLCIPIYARLWILIQLPATLTTLCHIKRDNPLHIMCAKCPPSTETHASIFWHFPETV